MAPHVLLDVVLVVALLGHLVRGWRSGGATSLCAMTGVIGGGLLGLWLGPKLLDWIAPDPESPLAAGQVGGLALVLVFAFVTATVGEALLIPIGWKLRALARNRVSRTLDRLVGMTAHGLAFVMIVSALGTAAKPALPTSWAATMNASRVLPVIDRLSPDAANRWAAQVTHQLDGMGFPRVFSGLQPEPVIPAPAPDDSAKGTPAVRRAAASIVKVTAQSRLCSRGQEGSGWVVAPHRVVTNAHVVAGAQDFQVQVTGRGPRLEASVVAFDPSLDLAILDVPALRAPALERAGELAPRADAVVAGFPLNGGYTVRAARIRGVVRALGDDIYGRNAAAREVYSINATVRPGNSGGPLLTPQGTVAGTVFARSTVDASTGYVLTDKATDQMLDRAASYRTPLTLDRCAVA